MRPEEEADLELRNHIEERVERLTAEGWNDEEARAEAHRRFGDLSAYRRELAQGNRARAKRAHRRLRLDQMWWDLRYAIRSLRRSPTFAGVVVVTLAIGVGANAAVYTVVDSVLLAPLPYERAEDLVLIWGRRGAGGARSALAAPDVAFFREHARGFEGFAFMNRVDDSALGDEAGSEHVRQAIVSADFFEVLGVTPALGRGFRHEVGETPGSSTDTEIVLSDGVWRRVFGANPDVVGRNVLMNGLAATVAGVLPRGFAMQLPPDVRIATDIDVWTAITVPLSLLQRADGRFVDQDSDNSGAVIARLGVGTDMADASVEMSRIARELRVEVSSYATAGLELEVRSLREDVTAHVRGLLVALGGGVAAVLLVAWLNISTLLLARGRTRESEIAVRMALGADRRRIVSQVCVESLVLIAVGGVLALAVAQGGTALLEGRLPPGLSVLEGASFSRRTLLFMLALGGLTTVVMAGVSLLQLSVGRGSSVGSFSRNRGRGGVRRALVVGEVALAVCLVVTAGLLIRSTGELADISPGFESADVLSFTLSLRRQGAYRGPSDRAVLMREIESDLLALPGVQAVGLVGRLPLAGRQWTQPYGLPGQPQTEWAIQRADFRMITSGFFDAIGTRLLEGRSFTRGEDLSEEHRVVIVDARLATRIAPTGSAVGSTIGFPLDGRPVEARVVGVVENVRYQSLEVAGRETLYVPYRQEASRDVSFVVRTPGPRALIPAVREVLRAIDPLIPVYDLRPLADYVDEAIAPTRFLLALLGSFAFLALLSAAVGLYGLISYEVSRTKRDIGIRIAIGAGTGDVVGTILTDGLRLAGLGIVAGAGLSALAARILGSVVYGVGVADPVTWVVVVSVVLAVTCIACWVPARYAAGLDPTIALRSD